ncbi:aldehyde dehydrogenase family protein [Glaciibacter superstes]|uniref:aldehyde dehydrogenase family protein n=1 Tax=Glaciibacter superstes TaxID=501023 RepID=UPI001B7FD8D9|nr:aldehyde dehydrogenase family protein [Glaciibacter superstes]
MLIGGEWVSAHSSQTFDVFDPGTEEVIAKVARGEIADVDDAVASARQAFDSRAWLRLAPAERSRIIWRIADLIEQNADAFAELESRNQGMPIASAKGGVATVARVFRYYAGWADKIGGRSMELMSGGRDYHAYTLREPIGVAALIVPWNFPLLMAAWKIAPALAAGCTCILKPAEETPLTALWLGKLCMDAGVPAGVVNVLTGLGHEAGAGLTGHDDVDKVAFTGSTEVGKQIIHAAAGNLKKLTLELGGKSPVVILDDADIEAAIPAAANAIFSNAGQVCTAGSRLLVHRRHFDQVVEGVSGIAANLKIGYGLEPGTQMGPLVSAKQRERVMGYIDSGVREGAAVRVGGTTPDTGYYIAPTVMTDLRPDMLAVQEEIFGPVVAAMPYEDIDEIAARANDTPYGLAASVWTKDVQKAHRVARAIKAGRVGINVHGLSDVAMPTGGYKQSGWGRELGPEGLEAFLETKSVFAAL